MHTVSRINYTAPNTTDLGPTTVRLDPTSKSWGKNRFSHCLNGGKNKIQKQSTKKSIVLSEKVTLNSLSSIYHIFNITLCAVYVCVRAPDQIFYSMWSLANGSLVSSRVGIFFIDFIFFSVPLAHS